MSVVFLPDSIPITPSAEASIRHHPVSSDAKSLLLELITESIIVLGAKFQVISPPVMFLLMPPLHHNSPFLNTLANEGPLALLCTL